MRVCLKCGKELKKKSQIKFCSNSCSASFNNKGKRKWGKSPNQCLVCYKKTKSYINKFCSHSCEQVYRWNEIKVEIKSGKTFNSHTMKKYLLEEQGIICKVCFITKWLGKEVPLVMDHIDGNSDNNIITNLRLVCGNCDMQLPTYKSKNRGKGRYFRRVRYKEGKSY